MMKYEYASTKYHKQILFGQKLNMPALSVTSESFVPMLARLDECIEFIQNKVT